MLRRAVFALVLVGAAFGGGAAINGPGLAWLKRTFTGPTIIVDGAPAQPPASKGPLKQFPTANTPPLQLDIPRVRAAASPKKKAAPPVELAQADPPLLPESPSTPASDLAPLPKGATPENEPPPLASIAQAPPTPTPPTTPAPEPASMPPIDPGPMPKTDPVARLASVETTPAPAPSPSKDWADLRKRMKALGIGRYTIEGETDGRVKFSCVIPVEGLRAVGHHFEAEGDDEYQAAEATLKRIALWKATASQD